MKTPANALFCTCLVCTLLLIGLVSNGCNFYYHKTTTGEGSAKGPWETFSSKNVLLGDVVLDIVESPSGDIWLATWNGVSRLAIDGDGQEEWHSFSAGKGFLPKNITCLAVSSDGSIWAGCGMAGKASLARFDDNQWISVEAPDHLAENLLVDLAFDRDGVLWAATWGGGLIRYDGETWQRFTTEDGLASEFLLVVSPWEDELWIGSKDEGKGISRYFDGNFYNFDEHNSGLVDGNIHSICFQNDFIWFGTWGGANRVNMLDDLKNFEKWSTFTSFDNRLPDSFVRIVHVEGKNVWLGTDAGLAMFNGKDTWTTFTTTEKRTVVFDNKGSKTGEEIIATEGLASNHVFSLLVDKHGRVWVGTDQGVSRYTP